MSTNQPRAHHQGGEHCPFLCSLTLNSVHPSEWAGCATGRAMETQAHVAQMCKGRTSGSQLNERKQESGGELKGNKESLGGAEMGK